MIDKPSLPLGPLVESLVESYRKEPQTCRLDSGFLPSRDEIIELIGKIRELLFPGFFGRQNLTPDGTIYHLGHLLEGVHERLYRQIRHAIRHSQLRQGNTNCLTCDVSAATATQEFLFQLPRLRQTLATDVQAAFDGDPAAGSLDEIIFSYPGLLAVSIFRIAHELLTLGVPLIPRIMTEYAHSLTGVDIHPGATIGEFFFIDHGTGVVIGETTVIGSRVKIYQGVTLGALSTRGGQGLKGVKRHPTLEDETTVYSNASILGGDTVVGRGATINGGVFITASVPPYTIVSMKNPELRYRNRPPREFKQEVDFQI